MKSVALTDDELVLLDGRCAEKVQLAVDGAKARIRSRVEHADLAPSAAGLVADVVSEALTSGLLVFRAVRARHCSLCGKNAGYGVYKSGLRRGQPNYDRPLTFAGFEFARRFVSVQNYISVGGCAECVTPAVPAIVEALRGVPAEIPEKLRAEGDPARKRWDNRRCTQCGWEGHSGEMRQERTLMGDGTYPAGCPECEARNGFGRHPVELRDGFVVVDESHE